MSDDIDIEEHDVMDNPRIKNIFPDIASIKTEVIDYEEESQSADAEYQDEQIKCENYEYLDEYEAVPIEYEETASLHQNKIILGSKPCTVDTEDDTPTIQECSIVLEDWRPVLENSPFCKQCRILFPTENALDYHKMVAHSFLVAVSKNKAVKSTSKSAISAINFPSTSKEVVCSHCNKLFPSETALLKHTYELLPSNFEGESDCAKYGTYHSCKICSCVFVWKSHLFHHLQKIHEATNESFPIIPVNNLKCRHCSAQPGNTKAYNSHIRYRHPDLYYKKHVGECDMFKCEQCSNTFATAASLKIHTATQHRGAKSAEKPEVANILSPSTSTSIASKPAEPKSVCDNRRPIPKCTLYSCIKCQLHFVSCIAATEHSKKCVLTKGDWKCRQCRRTFKMADKYPHLRQHELSERFKVIRISQGVLDRVLCRCTSCDVCFDERSLLKYHSFNCSEHSSTYCSICEVEIHENAYKKHSRLHSEIQQSFMIINYIFYDGKPTLKSETKTISKHKDSKYKDSKYKDSKYKDSKYKDSKHKDSKHKDSKHKDSKHKDSKHKVDHKLKKQSINDNPKRETGFFLYYCPSCKLFMKVNKSSDKHDTGKCNKTLPKCLCKICGLHFTKKGYLSHQEVHKRVPGMRLKDITFRDIQTGQKMNPPFPHFKKCKKCKVCFFSGWALKNHVCDAEEVKNCDYCGDKLSDLAYKLHVPFHEYRKEKKLDAHIPELIKKYESLKTIWNILFLCEICDTVFDAYDEVVEHCQDHYCNMENYNVIITHCGICDLKFMGKSFERHQNLHSANDINKSSFKIINCNYDVLLFDAWSDIFEALAPEQIKQILQKSIYKDIRNIRMSVLVDKNTDLVVYKCGICKTMVDPLSISKHAQDRNNCVRITKFSCTICKFRFYSNKSLQAHQELHKNRQIDENSFKIISFNHEKDARVNDSLRSVSSPEPLKFIRCQHCGKLINKTKYPKHISFHANLEKKKPKQPKFVVRSKQRFLAVANPVTTFYRCIKCDVCVSKQNVKVHYCSKDKYKKKCSKCNLWFRVSNMQKHNTHHERYKFSKKDVEVINFRDGVVEGDTSKVVLQQCSVCGICLHNKSNIIKHKCVDPRHFKTCTLCEVPFRYSHFYIHQQFHETKTFSKKSITIVKFNPLIRKKVPLPAVKSKHKKAAKASNPRLLEVSKTLQEVDEASESSSQTMVSGNEVNCELSMKGFMRRITSRYFRCQECNVYFVTGTALAEHVKTCGEDMPTVVCDCGITFYPDTLDIHKSMQKCGSPGVVNLFIITLSSYDDSSEFDLSKCLYKCKKCDMYYLTLNTALNHFDENHPKLRHPVECETCNVWFSMMSNTKHNNIHHKQKNLSKTDLYHFEIDSMTFEEAMSLSITDQKVGLGPISDKSFERKKAIKRKLVETEPAVSKKVSKTNAVEKVGTGPNKSSQCPGEVFTCEVCGLSFINKKTLASHYSTGHHKTSGVKCKKCGLLFSQKSLKRHLEPPIPSSPKKSDDNSNDSSNSVVSQIENMSKLFKCGDCDVYFFTLDVCNDHMTDHHALDPTEYIACKICELQFLCENLGIHMRSHRNNSFNIDDLIVKEFRPNKETVDTYLALDRLKSKAVSTTTYFDNEDNKSDTVDSTNMDS